MTTAAPEIEDDASRRNAELVLDEIDLGSNLSIGETQIGAREILAKQILPPWLALGLGGVGVRLTGAIGSEEIGLLRRVNLPGGRLLLVLLGAPAGAR